MFSSDNLIEPLTFDDGEIDRFIQRHKCAIHRMHLVAYPAPGRKWTANCPECGPVTQHSYVKKSRLERVVSDEHAGIVELKIR